LTLEVLVYSVPKIFYDCPGQANLQERHSREHGVLYLEFIREFNVNIIHIGYPALRCGNNKNVILA